MDEVEGCMRRDDVVKTFLMMTFLKVPIKLLIDFKKSFISKFEIPVTLLKTSYPQPNFFN